MALSNIVREPRREITESALGLGVFVIFLYADYHFAMWFRVVTADPGGGGCPWPLGMIIGVILMAFSVLILLVTHTMGEGICNFLAKHGRELRPKQRRRG